MKKAGIIQSLNISPKGFYEGFLLKTSKGIVQINLPKHEIEIYASALIVGEAVTAEVEAVEKHGKPDHEVFSLVRFKSGSSNKKDTEGHFSARVEGLNYALHGEVNGGILDTGDFLHLKPAGARAVEIEVGMEVTGYGTTRPMVGGRKVIEAEEVNGIAVRHHHHGVHAKHADKKHSPKKQKSKGI